MVEQHYTQSNKDVLDMCTLNLEPLSLDNLDPFLKIRNMSREMLHDSRYFTLKECKKWFIYTDNFYYFIIYNQEKIGYFRLKTQENFNRKELFIGCDLHPNFRGKGIGFKSYVYLLQNIIREMPELEIKLKVLKKNKIALGLYKKLGFLPESEFIKGQDILMVLSKKHFFSASSFHGQQPRIDKTHKIWRDIRNSLIQGD